LKNETNRKAQFKTVICLLDQNFLVYDLIYKPAETLLLKKAKEQGALVKNGFEMLLLQAEENWLIWNK
jgi:shikimate dehydrogenase